MKNWEFFYFGGCYMHECPRSACCRFQCRIFSYLIYNLQCMKSRFNKVKGQFYLNLRPFGFNFLKTFFILRFYCSFTCKESTIYNLLFTLSFLAIKMTSTPEVIQARRTESLDAPEILKLVSATTEKLFGRVNVVNIM